MKKISTLLILFFGLASIGFAQTVVIGTQGWSTKNLDVSTFRNGDSIPEAKTNEEWKKAFENKQPTWCYYDNDPANGTKYGKLYNWFAVNDPRGLAYAGYHVPTDDEFEILEKYLGEQAGKKMKSTSGWLGLKNNNSSGFTGLPGGARYHEGIFDDIYSLGIWWSSTGYDTSFAKCRLLSMNNEISGSWKYIKSMGLSVRCIKNEEDYDFDFGDLELKGTNSKHSEDDYDFDFGDLELKGTNSKNSKDDYFDFGDIELKGSNCGCMVTIGQQVWAKENLNTERFRNGDLIPEAKTKEEWTKAKDNKQPAWCYYNNDSANGTKYGKLYNWYAINDPRGLAPNGWHIPSTQEVGELVNFLGGKDDANKKMKTTNLWMDKYKGTNSSSFSAVPGGFRSSDGKFWNGTFEVYFWTTSLSSYIARPVIQFRLGNRVQNIYAFFGEGAYVRCIKN